MSEAKATLWSDVKDFSLKLKSHFDSAVSGGYGYGAKLATRAAAAVVATVAIMQTGMILPFAAVLGGGLSLWYGVRTERALTGGVAKANDGLSNPVVKLHDRAAEAVARYQSTEKTGVKAGDTDPQAAPKTAPAEKPKSLIPMR